MTPAYHVIIGDTVQALGKNREIVSDAMTPSQALAEGYSLDAIQGEMAASMTLALDAEKEAHKKTREDRERIDALLGEAKAINAKANESLVVLANENQSSKNVIANLLADITTLDEAVRVQALRADTAETKLNQAIQTAQLAGVAVSSDAAEKQPSMIDKFVSFIKGE
jgi:hypothetical protein